MYQTDETHGPVKPLNICYMDWNQLSLFSRVGGAGRDFLFGFDRDRRWALIVTSQSQGSRALKLTMLYGLS